MSLFRNLIVFLLGLTTGLWLMERQKRQELEAEKLRPVRTMSDLSPTYKQFAAEFDAENGNHTLKMPEQHADRFRAVLREINFAALNQQEINRVKEKLEELVDMMWIDAQDLIDPNTLSGSEDY